MFARDAALPRLDYVGPPAYAHQPFEPARYDQRLEPTRDEPWLGLVVGVQKCAIDVKVQYSDHEGPRPNDLASAAWRCFWRRVGWMPGLGRERGTVATHR